MQRELSTLCCNNDTWRCHQTSRIQLPSYFCLQYTQTPRHVDVDMISGVSLNLTSLLMLIYVYSCLHFLLYRLPLCRHYSTSKVGRGVASKLQKANTKYEGFLKRRFPRFFQLYHTFVEGKPAVYSPLRSSVLYF